MKIRQTCFWFVFTMQHIDTQVSCSYIYIYIYIYIYTRGSGLLQDQNET